MAGYHVKDIKRGELGEFSKIREEFEELEDALEQGNNVMALLELADMLGAMEEFIKKWNLTLKDLNKMKEATQKAFKDGTRTSR